MSHVLCQMLMLILGTCRTTFVFSPRGLYVPPILESMNQSISAPLGEDKWGKVLFCVLCSVVFSVMDVLHVLCCVLMCVAGCVVLYSEL